MSDSSRKSHGIGAAVDKLFRSIEILIAIFLGAMIFFTFMNVVLRQFGIGFPWSEEIARICFIYLIYLGAIIAARENQHLMIDTLICKLPPLGQKVLYFIIQGLVIWLMWILTNGAFLNAWNNRNDFWVATHFPVFLVHFAGVLLGASVIIISLVNLYRMFVLKEPVVELPIAMALLLCAVCTALAMGGGDANPTIIARTLMQGSDSVTMMALPFFVLAGEIMNRGGLTKRIIAFCDVFLGRIRGGLGYVTIFACLMFAALVGSAVAACAALGAILIPMMVRSGYNREESSALVASANLVAPIMPPSVPMIVYGVSAGVSIKSMFMAGIAPAVYLTIIACVVWFLRTRKEGVVPSVEDFKAPTPKEAVRIFLGGLWALLLPVIILVGLHSGKFTATEAGVIACVYAILVGLLVYREMKLKDLGPVFVSAAKTSAVVMFLAAAANVAAYYMTVSRIPQLLTAGLEGLVDNPTLLMIVLMLIVVVVGLAMDVTPSILILTPIMLPLVKAAGISPIYFGVCFVLMNVLGLTSPPVGPVLNVACAAGNVKMDKIIPPTMPYFLTQTALCFLLAIFPPLIEVPLKWFGG